MSNELISIEVFFLTAPKFFKLELPQLCQKNWYLLQPLKVVKNLVFIVTFEQNHDH